MKQWIVLIISIILIIGFGIFEIKYLSNTCTYLLSDIEYCRNAVENGNFKLANQHVEDVNDTWNYLKTSWGVFIDHEEIGNIEEEMLKFKLNVKNDNKEEAIMSCRQLEQIILHAVRKQEISVQNVF